MRYETARVIARNEMFRDRLAEPDRIGDIIAELGMDFDGDLIAQIMQAGCNKDTHEVGRLLWEHITDAVDASITTHEIDDRADELVRDAQREREHDRAAEAWA